MLHYANEESDDVINSFTNNTESRISPERLEQCSYNLAQEIYIVKKRQNDTYHVVAMATLWAPVSFYEKPNILLCNSVLLKSRTEGLGWDTHGSHIALALLIRLLRVYDPCLRLNLGILVLKQDQRLTSIMITRRRVSC